MKATPIILYLLCFVTGLQAQSIDSLYTIKGRVVNEQGIALSNTSIGLYRTDSSLATAAASDEKGNFSLRASNGNYLLKLSFTSFRETTIQVSIAGDHVMLQDIILTSSPKLLSEVVISSEKKLLELQLDKKVYNVSQDVSNIGANASEILGNIPSVDVDMEGNVSLRGSQGVRILIDGKPSALTGIRSTDVLRNLQGALIDRIEVITNPSSRYDAAGETGIINIILKKNKTRGFNGNFTAIAGYPANLGASYSVNYRNNKVNFFSNFGLNYRKNTGDGFSWQQFNGSDTSFRYDQHTDQRRSGFSQNIMAGLDYYLSPMITLTGSVLYSGSREENVTDILYEDFNESGQLTKSTLRNDTENERERDTEVSFSLQKKFADQPKRELTADFKWTNSGETERSAYTQTELANGTTLNQRSGNPAWEDNLLLQTDYIHPYGEDGKFETGFKLSRRNVENEFLVEEQDASGNWNTLPAFNNNMEFRERVYAAYLMAGNKFKKFSYQLGLRAEYSDMRTGLTKTAEINERTYFNLFPSGNLAYELNDKNTIQFNYSYRINRPNFRNLTPFADFSDPRVYFVGNPNLNPEYTHSMEVNHLLDWGRSSLMSGIYYRYKTGVVERIRILDTVTGITNIIPVNLSTQHDIGLETNLSLEVKNWWKLNTSLNFFRSEANGSYEQVKLHSKTVSMSGRLISRITFWEELDFQTSFNYRAPRVTTQGKQLSIYSIDLGLARDVFKGRGTLTFNVRDLMNSRRRRSIISLPGYDGESDFLWRPRQFTLSLNFRLNQQKIEKEEEQQEEI